jgi:hypothetical protein
MHSKVDRLEFIEAYLRGVFSESLHAKRILSLANGVLGVMTSASLAVAIIGSVGASTGSGFFYSSKRDGRPL